VRECELMPWVLLLTSFVHLKSKSRKVIILETYIFHINDVLFTNLLESLHVDILGNTKIDLATSKKTELVLKIKAFYLQTFTSV